MVRFLEHHDPKVEIVAIDIDAMILEIADKYFGTRPSKGVRLIATDGIDFIRSKGERFDVIYMDAFLKPSDETNSTGAPLRLHTAPFYDAVKERLEPGGVVVFNLNTHRRLNQDLRTIRTSFPQTYRFTVPNSGNVVVIGSPSEQRESYASLLETANELDERFATEFSFRILARRLSR